MNERISNGIHLGRTSARAARRWWLALAVSASLLAGRRAVADAIAPQTDMPSPRPHAVGDVFNYAVRGTMSTAIDGHDAFGHQVRQIPTPTVLLGRERIAIKDVTAQGLALHRSGSIVATFRGKSSPPQSGAGWTLVTPDGKVEDRKGSTLGGLFLLPLGFLGDRAVDQGGSLQTGDRWSGKLGVALFGMTARPRMTFQVAGTREIFGTTVYSVNASGTAPIDEPIVTNDDVAMGDARGTAHLTLRYDYDPHLLRVVSMEIDVVADLRIAPQAHAAPGGSVQDRQHYLVALDAASLRSSDQPAPADPAASPAPSPNIRL